MERLFALSNDENFSELIENWHCQACEIYSCCLVLWLFLRRFLVPFFTTIKHRKSLDCFALPKLKPCYLLTVTIVELDFDVFCLSILVRKEKDVLMLDKVDAV